jgi:hypothetical protein
MSDIACRTISRLSAVGFTAARHIWRMGVCAVGLFPPRAGNRAFFTSAGFGQALLNVVFEKYEAWWKQT